MSMLAAWKTSTGDVLMKNISPLYKFSLKAEGALNAGESAICRLCAQPSVRIAQGQPANWANDESSPLLDDIVVFTASGQIRLLEANQISPDILNQLLGVLLNLVVEKFEASVTAQTRAHVFGNEKTLLVPSQYGEEVRDAANNLQEITWSVAVPPCPSQLVTIGEPVSEGQWLARITGTMADYRVGRSTASLP